MAEVKIGMRIKAKYQMFCTSATGGSGGNIYAGTTGTVQATGTRPTIRWDSGGYTTYLNDFTSVVLIHWYPCPPWSTEVNLVCKTGPPPPSPQGTLFGTARKGSPKKYTKKMPSLNVQSVQLWHSYSVQFQLIPTFKMFRPFLQCFNCLLLRKCRIPLIAFPPLLCRYFM